MEENKFLKESAKLLNCSIVEIENLDKETILAKVSRKLGSDGYVLEYAEGGGFSFYKNVA